VTRCLAFLLLVTHALAVPPAETRMTSNEVARVIAQAISRAEQIEPHSVIAVVDR